MALAGTPWGHLATNPKEGNPKIELWDRQPPPPVTVGITDPDGDTSIEEAVDSLGKLVVELGKCVGEFTIYEGSYIAERATLTALFIYQQYEKLDEIGESTTESRFKVAKAIEERLAG